MIITIARQCGCGAIKIGKELSARYNIPFYTRMDLLEMARNKGVLEAMDDFFEERPVDELMFAISSFFTYNGNLFYLILEFKAVCIFLPYDGVGIKFKRAIAR